MVPEALRHRKGVYAWYICSSHLVSLTCLCIAALYLKVAKKSKPAQMNRERVLLVWYLAAIEMGILD
jgi:hypothetical protein